MIAAASNSKTINKEVFSTLFRRGMKTQVEHMGCDLYGDCLSDTDDESKIDYSKKIIKDKHSKYTEINIYLREKPLLTDVQFNIQCNNFYNFRVALYHYNIFKVANPYKDNVKFPSCGGRWDCRAERFLIKYATYYKRLSIIQYLLDDYFTHKCKYLFFDVCNIACSSDCLTIIDWIFFKYSARITDEVIKYIIRHVNVKKYKCAKHGIAYFLTSFYQTQKPNLTC